MATGFSDDRSQDEAKDVKSKDRERDRDHERDRDRYRARERGRDRNDRYRDRDPHNRKHCGYSDDRDYHNKIQMKRSGYRRHRSRSHSSGRRWVTGPSWLGEQTMGLLNRVLSKRGSCCRQHQQVQMQRLMYQVGGALPTKVVCLTQVVSVALLGDDEEYRDILQDMTIEGSKHGNLKKVVIRRPERTGAGVGKDLEESTRAKISMHGRRFDGNLVVAVLYPGNKYADKIC